MATLSETLKKIRNDYSLLQLDEKTIFKNPIKQFELWLNEAIKAKVAEPNAMTLSTVDDKGMPNSRIVLLRGIEKNKFVFFSNYNSSKAKEISGKASVALNFFWPEKQRQVRVRGTITKLSDKASHQYFNTRPRISQLGAWASAQSETVINRKQLDDAVLFFETQFKNKPVPKPKHWGGYVVTPISIEFWQGRSNRLHDRIYFERKVNTWKISRLSP